MTDVLPAQAHGNGNGHKPAVEALPAAVTEVDWHPTSRDLKYLQAVIDAIDADGRLSNGALATRMGISRQAIWKMEKRPGFIAWVNAQIRKETDDLWPKAVRRTAVLAARGSIDHFNALAKLRGEIRESAPVGGPTANTFNGQTVVIIHE
jgi:hypothetical protein